MQNKKPSSTPRAVPRLVGPMAVPVFGILAFLWTGASLAVAEDFHVSIQPRAGFGDQFLLEWPSKAGKSYQVEASANLQDGFTARVAEVQATQPDNAWWIGKAQLAETPFLRVAERDPGNYSGPRAAALRMNARLGAGNNFMAAKSMSGNGAPEDYQLLNRSGFSHCRIGYKMDEVAGPAPDHLLPEGDLQSLQAMVDWCLSEGLIPVVDPVHNWANNNDPSMEYDNTAANRLKLQRIWEQVAAHFADYPVEDVVFEIMNEPHSEDNVAQIISIGLAAIRGVAGNGERVVIVPGDGFSTRQALIDALDNDEIPADDPWLIGTFHYYDPRPFTKQGDNPDISWGTMAEMADVASDFDEVVAANTAWAQRNGTDPLPLYLGEFGVDNEADNWNNDRERWLSWIRMQAEARDISWAHWNMYNNSDSSKGMGPWTTTERFNPATRTFDAGPLEALIGRYTFESGSTGGGVTISNEYPGFAETGYATFPEATGVAVWARADGIYLPATGTSLVEIHYASDTDRTVRLVTGAQVLNDVIFPSTGGFYSWATLRVEIDFNASTGAGMDEESLKIVATPDRGPNLDWVHVTAPSP